jgi:hypothetical protein
VKHQVVNHEPEFDNLYQIINRDVIHEHWQTKIHIFDMKTEHKWPEWLPDILNSL